MAIADFPKQRPFIRNQTALFRELRPGVAVLPAAAPILADAFEAGTEVLPKTIQMNEDLADVFDALADFSDDPLVRGGIDQLTRLGSSLRPTLRFLTPTQTVCNYATLWFRNAASVLSEGDPNGNWQRFMIVAAPLDPITLAEARTTRAVRRARRPTAPGSRTTSTTTPTRIARRPARRASARPATSATPPAGRSSPTPRATRARRTSGQKGAGAP